MNATPTPELERLGDDLERAAAGDLASRRRRASRVRIAGLAVVALTILATGTAMAAGLFTPKQVAAGMPAGAVIFGNTDPSCRLDADGITYGCTLDVAPQADDGPAQAIPGKPAGPADPRDYLGTKEPIGVDGVVAGGCIGRSSDGLRWDCYIGVEAVTRGIIGADFLGEPMTGPGRG